MNFIVTYPYFTNATIMLAVCLAAMAIFRHQRRIALESALLTLPWGIWGVALVPEYWTPRLIIHIGKLGPEDFIWAFATGGLAWICAAELSRTKWQSPAGAAHSTGRTARRYGVIAAIGA